MKLLVAAALYPPQEGGPATYAKLLHDELPARGVVVDILPFAAVGKYPRGVRHALYFFRLLRRGRRADVLYAQDAVSVGVPALWASRLLRRPLLLKIVGDHAWEQGVQRFGVTEKLDAFPLFSPRWPRALRRLRRLQLRVARCAACVVVPSEYLKRLVLAWGVPESRVRVIHNGVDFSEVPVPPAARPEGFMLVTVARLVPWKGVGALIDIAAAEKDWTLIIVGDGPARPALEARAQECGAGERVRFTGRLPHAQALGWIQAGDCFVLNSSYEGLSHTLLEALRLSRPTVATKVGGNAEVIEDGVDGVLVPPDYPQALHAALKKIAEDPARAAALGAHAAHTAQRFSTEATIRQLCEILNTL